MKDDVPPQTDAPETWQPFTVAFNGTAHGFSEVVVRTPQVLSRDGKRVPVCHIVCNG